MPMITLFQPAPGDCIEFDTYVAVLIYQPIDSENRLGLIAVDSLGNCTRVEGFQFRKPSTFENCTVADMENLPQLQQVAIRALQATQI